MATVTFNTLKFVETLEKAKLTREQATAIAAAVRDAQESADVATRGDVRVVEAKLDLIKWMLGFLLAGMISLLVKTFF